MASQHFFHQRLLLLPFLLLTLTTTTVNGCGALNLTLERCSTSKDCAGHDPLSIFPTPFCAGRDRKDAFVVCPNPDVKLCICYTGLIRGCDTHSECPDEQFCAISPRTGNASCIGCLSFNDSDIGFVSIDEPMPRDRCTNLKSHPPCGRVLDYCNGDTMLCKDDNECVAVSGDELFGCSAAAVPCRCSNPLDKDAKMISVSDCKADNIQCGDERETCAYDTRFDYNFCASCDAIDKNPFLIHLNDSKCVDLPKRKSPAHYNTSPNGKSFDLCESDVKCTGEKKCVSFVHDEDGVTDISTFAPCPDLVELCFCRAEGELQKCSTGQDCTRGESCVTSDVIGAKKNCVSNGYIHSLSPNLYEIEGKFTGNGDGELLNEDSCKFDWDCKKPRRCTHVAELWGGCAGRGACVCKQLDNPECFSDGDCEDENEVCVNYIDGKSKAMCISKTYVGNNSGILKPPGFVASPPTRPVMGNGLTGDDCLDDTDCVDERTCQHKNEQAGGCEGRNWCSCLPKEGFPTNCTISTDCPSDGEICVGVKDMTVPVFHCVSAISYDSDTSGFNFEVDPRPPSASPSPSISTVPATSTVPGEQNIGIQSLFSVEPSVSAEPTVSAEADDLSEVESSDGSTTPDASNPAEAVCIDIKLLQHLSSDQLVFSESKRAGVLCDSEGSCATPGHIVMYNNVAMSMNSYCSVTQCSKRVSWVNSPRMKYGLRINSLTTNLHMTALAAAHESQIEEFLLTRLIRHLGF